jgi:hypothetical protein
MWKEVCSDEGELLFANWIKTLLIETQMEKQPNDDEEVNPDPAKYLDTTTLNLLYEILNVKLTHGIGFKTFFDLMQEVSEDMGLIDIPDSEEDYVHVDVLEIFCKNFIRGFSKLIVDLGFDVNDISI